MHDDENDPGLIARTSDTVTDVKTAIDNASDEVSEIGMRLKSAWDHSRGLKSSVEFIESATRAVPLAALGVAFLFGVMFATGRRR